ncbi:MAG: hypothetical protein IPI38_14160 [Gemmatimonadetes bacterium]|nr:hypothetical protein [Gemmatimonadota bacterium]
MWIVDPLDGTRDFVAGSGDCAVHVALAVEGVPVVAAVAWPADGAVYVAVRGGGALRHDAQGAHPLSVAPARPLAQYRTGITRTAMHPALERFLARGGLAAAAEPRGASIKHLLLAGGALDCCVTLHDREHGWDTAAPGLIVTEAGGTVTDADGVPFRYSQPDVGASSRGAAERRPPSRRPGGTGPGVLAFMNRPIITVDGVDGCGKSTFAARLVTELAVAGATPCWCGWMTSAAPGLGQR